MRSTILKKVTPIKIKNGIRDWITSSKFNIRLIEAKKKFFSRLNPPSNNTTVNKKKIINLRRIVSS